MDSNTKLLVCCHKKDIMLSDNIYMPIHVGKSQSQNNLDIQTDNEGDNISDKNFSYCELTGMYWAWKNLNNIEYIGLCHYRRYFDFHGQIKGLDSDMAFTTEKFNNLNFDLTDEITDLLSKGFIIVPRKRVINYTLYVDYCISHYSDDIRILEKIIHEKGQDKYIKAFDEIMHHNNKLFPFNMFVMPFDKFSAYCEWLFDILEEAEKRINISNYTTIQKRIFGYMSERLFNVYLHANNLKTKELPVIFVSDEVKERDSQLFQILKQVKNNIITKLN
ncbi:DUF4422 domain-containing protein [Epilithonimonas vandammei]|uniref:DUF4422 domain-containing protein n=1 Tax=Epilithonimonas vandammei TaxID=2487072 RepID=UPI002897606A|nr:DUF4422 domain-containing protein [Epilithonimonas vandammei]